MNFLTSEQIGLLLYNGDPTDQDLDMVPVVKLFVPFTRFVCLLNKIVEVRDRNGRETYWGFGLIDEGHGAPELDYVQMEDLEKIQKCHPLQLGIKADERFIGKHRMSLYEKAAAHYLRITTDDIELRPFLERASHHPTKYPRPFF